MTSTKQIGRISAFTFAVGAGMLIAAGSGSAVASASTGESGHSSASSGSTASSARGGSTATAVKKQSRTTPTVSSSRVTVKPAAANSVPRHLTLVSPAAEPVDSPGKPTATASRLAAPAVPRLPTPEQVAQTVQRALESFGRDLNRLFGIHPAAVAHSTSTAGWNPQPGDVIYGNIDNAKYWQNQGNTNTCVLMSTAMVIGQLTGNMPTQQQIVAEAEATTSPVGRTGTYTGTDGVQRTRNGAIYQSINNEYVYYADSLTMLYNHKIAATATYYTDDQSERAISDLEAALGRGDSVIVTINSAVRNSVITRRGAFTGGTVTANHAVTIVAVNATQGKVYINDTALDEGEGNPLEMSVSDFVAAWQPGKYTLITAHLMTPQEQALTTGPAQFQQAA